MNRRRRMQESLDVLEAKIDYLTTVVDLLLMHHDMSQPRPIEADGWEQVESTYVKIRPGIVSAGDLESYYRSVPLDEM